MAETEPSDASTTIVHSGRRCRQRHFHQKAQLGDSCRSVREWSLTTRRLRQTEHLAPSISNQRSASPR